MNNERRKTLNEIQQGLEALKERLQEVQQEEQSAVDNLPEGILASERGQKMEASADALDTAVGNLDEAIDMINEACA